MRAISLSLRTLSLPNDRTAAVAWRLSPMSAFDNLLGSERPRSAQADLSAPHRCNHRPLPSGGSRPLSSTFTGEGDHSSASPHSRLNLGRAAYPRHSHSQIQMGGTRLGPDRGDERHAHAAWLVPVVLAFSCERDARRAVGCRRAGEPRSCGGCPGGALLAGQARALVRSFRLAGGQGSRRGRRGHDRARHRGRPRRRSAGAAQPDRRRQAALCRRARPRARHRLDLPARRRARHRLRSRAVPAQRRDHPDRQGHRREHQHDGRPRHHALGRHAQPARRPRERLDQAGPDGSGRQQPDRGPRCLRLAGGRRDRARLDRLRSPPGRAAHRRRRRRERDSTRPAARVHALRRDHLRRRRARRGRPPDPQHPHPRLGRRRAILFRAGTSWRWRARGCTSRGSSSTAWAST